MWKFSLSELFFAFLSGVCLVTCGIILIALHSQCSCRIGQPPTYEQLASFLNTCIVVMVVWTIGLAVAIIKNHMDS